MGIFFKKLQTILLTTAIIRAWMKAGPHPHVKTWQGCAAASGTGPAPAESRTPAALLAVFALAPAAAVGAHAFDAAVAAVAPLAVMLANAGTPAILAGVPPEMMLDDAAFYEVCFYRNKK